jgi:hypothetical protein
MSDHLSKQLVLDVELVSVTQVEDSDELLVVVRRGDGETLLLRLTREEEAALTVLLASSLSRA